MFNYFERTEMLNALGAAAPHLAPVRLSVHDGPSLRVSLAVPGGQHLDLAVVSLEEALTRPSRPDELIVDDAIPAATRDRLKLEGRPFLDGLGNAWVQAPGTYLDIRSGRRRKTATSHPVGPSTFTPKGLQVLFVLLAFPQARALSMAELGAASMVSVGTVHNSVADLEARGFLIRPQGPIRLVRITELAEQWVGAYRSTLSHRLHLAYFSAPSAPRIDEDAARSADVVLGGTAALPHRAWHEPVQTIYARAVPSPLILRERWRRVSRREDAHVEVRRQFWTDPSGSQGPGGPRALTPPLLTYADLTTSDDPRLQEAGEEMRRHDDRLVELFGA